MLTSGEVAAMRTVVADSLPDTCDIQEATRVFDEAGGWADTFATARTVRCRVRPAGQITPTEQVQAARLQGRVPFSVTLAYTDGNGDRTVVTEAHRIVPHIGGGAAGDPLEVIGVADPLSWQASVRTTCAKAR